MANSKKPGKMTTELWVTLASALAITFTLVGKIDGTTGNGIAIAGCAIGVGLIALGYSESRGKAKS